MTKICAIRGGKACGGISKVTHFHGKRLVDPSKEELINVIQLLFIREQETYDRHERQLQVLRNGRL